MESENRELEREGGELGTCCVCEVDGPYVRNIVMLDRQHPTPGKGWGCFVCNLPNTGATAVICDACAEKHAADPNPPEKWIRFACAGDDSRERVSLASLKGRHRHDLTMHDEIPFEQQAQQPLTVSMLQRWRAQALCAQQHEDRSHVAWVVVKDGVIVPAAKQSTGLRNKLEMGALAMQLAWKRLIILIDDYVRLREFLAAGPYPAQAIGTAVHQAGADIEPNQMLAFDADGKVVPVPPPAPVPLPVLPADEVIQSLCWLGGVEIPPRVIATWSEDQKWAAFRWAEAEGSDAVDAKPNPLVIPPHVAAYLPEKEAS